MIKKRYIYLPLSFFLIFIFYNHEINALSLEAIKKTLSDTEQVLSAIYEFTVKLIDFFSVLLDWMGFRAFAAAMGIYFCYRFIDGFFPASRIINIVIGLCVFTFLWLMWNEVYHESYKLDVILYTYGFLFSHILALFIIQKIILYAAKKMKRIYIKTRKQNINILEFYDMIDNYSLALKNSLKNGRKNQAVKILKELQFIIENSAEGEKNKNTYEENSISR
ncbi:MAG: hypothetical protein OEZ13_01375 [Spirochaetia bacterium]|nr:hypothetical protein [Spirochaetia bacterium]